MACSKHQRSENIEVLLSRTTANSYGFGLYGGTERTPGFLVSVVVPNGEAYRKGLRVYDSIEEIDNQTLNNETHSTVISYVKSRKSVRLKIHRRNADNVRKELIDGTHFPVMKRKTRLSKNDSEQDWVKIEKSDSIASNAKQFFGKSIVLGSNIYTEDEFLRTRKVLFEGDNCNAIIGKNGKIVNQHDTVAENIKVTTLEALKAQKNMNQFVPTTAFKDATAHLERFGMVVLVGGHGTGKSFLGQQLLLHFSEGEDPKTPFTLHESHEWKRVVNPKTDAIVLLDDVFGKFCFDPTCQGGGWENIFDVIQGCVRRRHVYLVMTMRDNVFRNADLQAILAHHCLFKDIDSFTVDINALSREEKIDIFNSHLVLTKLTKQSTTNENIEAIIEGNFAFPLVCSEYTSKLEDQADPTQFSETSINIAIKDMRCMIYYDKHALFLLLWILLSPSQKIIKTELCKTGVQTKKRLLKDISLLCGLNMDFSTYSSVLKRKAQDILESYILDDGTSYAIKSEFVLISLIKILAPVDLHIFIENADFFLVDQYLRAEREYVRNRYAYVFVDVDEYVDIAERILKEIRKGKLQSVATCSFIHNKGIVDELMTLLHRRKIKTTELFEKEWPHSLLNYAIENTPPPLHLISKISDAMTISHRNQALASIQQCCKLKKWDAFKLLYRHAKPLPEDLRSIVKRDGSRDVQIYIKKH